jgi:serine O-acetyltransferase
MEESLAMTDLKSNDHQEELNSIVNAIFENLSDRGQVEHICTFDMPRREMASNILTLLRRLLFPGYYSPRAVSRMQLKQHLLNTAVQGFRLLRSEISKCLLHQWRESSETAREKANRAATEKTLTLLENLPSLIDMLDGDVEAAYLGDPAATGTDEIIACYPGFRAILTHRIAHEIHSLEVPLLPRVLSEHAHSETGIDIHPGADIGRNFFIDHGTGVVIGETSTIGDNVKIYQGVTLGALSFPTDEEGNLKRGFKRHPNIEDDVIIYSNASILGNITVGKGSIVGGNVFLTHSVKPGSKVTREGPGHTVQRLEG